jgi:hypothetical protein
VLAVVPVTTIRKLDQELRRVVKIFFHLLQCKVNGLLYCRKKDEGLRIPKLETMTVSSSIKAGLQFLESDDPVIRALAGESRLDARLSDIARAARIDWPIEGREDRPIQSQREEERVGTIVVTQITRKSSKGVRERWCRECMALQPDYIQAEQVYYCSQVESQRSSG